MEDEEQDGLVPLGGVEQEAAHEELEENVAPKVEEDQGLVSLLSLISQSSAPRRRLNLNPLLLLLLRSPSKLLLKRLMRELRSRSFETSLPIPLFSVRSLRCTLSYLLL